MHNIILDTQEFVGIGLKSFFVDFFLYLKLWFLLVASPKYWQVALPVMVSLQLLWYEQCFLFVFNSILFLSISK